MNKYKAKRVNGKKIDEHRFIMEQIIGRKLKRTEVVHHIDGDKSNNNINNLQVMTLSEHSRIHGLNRIVSEKTREKLRNSLNGRHSYKRNKTKKDIINIVVKYKETQNYRQVDRFFELANGTTGKIIRGKIYKEFKPIINEILTNKH